MPEGPSTHSMHQQNVWQELFGTAQGLEETVDLALQAFAPDPPDKKRLLIKALQGLKEGKSGIQLLMEHLTALQAASNQWQSSMMYASKSHTELMEQMEDTSRELHITSERLRGVEAERIVAVREAEGLRANTSALEGERKALQSALKQRDEELENAHFSLAEVHATMASMQEVSDRQATDAAASEDRTAGAIAALDSIKMEACKATSNAERHQEVVARLTADNLMFLLNLKKAEADLAAANQERSQLRLAAEEQRGPWFDQVRAGVEERVKLAMRKADALEEELSQSRAQHKSELGRLHADQEELQELLAGMTEKKDALEEEVKGAVDQQHRSQGEASKAVAALKEMRQQPEAL
eukprot:gene18915-25475_t